MTPVEKILGQTAPESPIHAPHHTVRDIICAPNSPIKNILQLARRMAFSSLPILITGPTGVGKENLACYIHNVSGGTSDERPFIDINCGAVPENLFEAELFGHTKGAFTGALSNRNGYMASAERGTLFLDEIGEMPLSLQPKMLRVLETRMFRPVGSTRQQPFEGRIIAATHRDIASLSQQGLFREDLFYRLAVFSLEIPSLAQRQEDIPVLVEYFSSLHKKRLIFTEEGMAYLKSYSWPGNIRELRNLIDRLGILTDAPVIDKTTLVRFLSPASSQRAFSLETFVNSVLDMPEKGDKLAMMEQLLISGALHRSKGNKTQAAHILGIGRKAVERKVTRLEHCAQSAQASVDKADIAMRHGDFTEAIAILEACFSKSIMTHELMRNETLLCNINYLLSICHQRTSGWMSGDGLRYCQVAAGLARRIGDATIIQSTMFLAWTSLLMSLNLIKARNTANELLLHAKEKGKPIFVQEGYIAVANTSFWLGDCKEVISVLTESGLLASSEDGAYSTLHQIDLQSLGIMLHGLACFQTGEFGRARSALESLLVRSGKGKLARQDCCFVLQGIAWLACLFEEWELMGSAANELKKLAKDNTYSFFLGIGKFFYGRYLLEQGQSVEAEKEMTTGYERYVLYEGGLLFQSFQAWQRGELLLRQGRAHECMLLISPSINISIRLQERVYLVELMELHARAQAALGDRDAAKSGFESALATACVLCTVPARLRAAARLLDMCDAAPSVFDWPAVLETAAREKDSLPESLKQDVALLQSSCHA